MKTLLVYLSLVIDLILFLLLGFATVVSVQTVIEYYAWGKFFHFDRPDMFPATMLAYSLPLLVGSLLTHSKTTKTKQVLHILNTILFVILLVMTILIIYHYRRPGLDMRLWLDALRLSLSGNG